MTTDRSVGALSSADGWVRAIRSASGSDPSGGQRFERAGYVVHSDLRVGALLRGRPPGVTAHQWRCATRVRLAFVVAEAETDRPLFAIEMRDPDASGASSRRDDPMTDAVVHAAGLPLLRVESSARGLGSYARRLAEYVIDAYAFTIATADDDEIGDLPVEPPLSYRDIIGRLPDGRTGYVNDLGTLARAAAVDAYVAGQVADPIIRELRVSWRGGPGQGWAWLRVRDDLCVVERTRVWMRGFGCGLDAGRLAEDLATAAIGERFKDPETLEARLYDARLLADEFTDLQRRRSDMDEYFSVDHAALP